MPKPKGDMLHGFAFCWVHITGPEPLYLILRHAALNDLDHVTNLALNFLRLGVVDRDRAPCV